MSKPFDVEAELIRALNYECATEILKQEVPGITDEEISEVVSMEAVKTNWANAVPMYWIIKGLRQESPI